MRISDWSSDVCSSDLIVREHGGAFLKSVPQQVRALALQHHENMDEKRRIGRAAAALVGDGETIILDSGSPTTEVAAALTGRRAMTVGTNPPNNALMLGDHRSDGRRGGNERCSTGVSRGGPD